MAETFDPYRKWLGIPPDEQPADHYRLLGIGRFEDDADTISNAADRQMAHVRTFQAGPHSALSQKLLNEIAAARVCLLDRAKKAEYDARLRPKQALKAAQALPVAPLPPATLAQPAGPRSAPVVPMSEPVTLSTPAVDIHVRPTRTKKKRSSAVGITIGGAVLLAAIVGVVAIIGRNSGAKPSQARVASSPPAAKAVPPETAKLGSAGPKQIAAQPVGEKPAKTAARDAPPKPPAAATAAGPTLEIVEAKWGAGDRWQDITTAVQSQVADARLLATAAGNFFQQMPDPAPGQGKRVTIRYRAAGVDGTADFADGDFVYLAGRPRDALDPSSQGFEVLEARYGAETTWTDVLPRLRRWIHGNRLAVRVDLVAQNDPFFGQRKALFLRYRTADGEFITHAWDGEDLVLDARPIARGKSSDLLSAAEPESEASGGRWHRDGKVLVGPDREPGNLTVPAPFADDYLLTATLEGTPLPYDVGITLPVAGHRVQLLIDGSWRSASGLQWVDGAVITQNAATCRGTIFEHGQATFVQCAVGHSKIYATCNGRVIVDWQGDPARLSVPEPESTDKQTIVVRSMAIPWRLSQLRVAPLAAEKPRTVAGVSQAIDLLKLIDLKLDTVWGDWQLNAKGLMIPPAEAVRLQVPYSPGDDYELQVVAARKSGEGGLFIGLVVDGRQTMVAIDGWGGGVSGLHFLDGKTAENNVTRHDGAVFVDERPKTIVCTVHPSSVGVTADGQPLVDWKGDARRLSVERRLALPDELALGLAGWNTGYVISKFELRPLPPEPEAVAAVAGAPAEKPRSLTELLDNATAAPAKRLPVPSGKPLAAAEKKVEEMFAAKWKAANDLAQRLAVARELFDTGVQTTDDAALRYVLLREARRGAATWGDVGIACDAVEQIGRMFEIDTLAEKLAAVNAASERIQAPTQLGIVALTALLLADRAAAEARFDEARKFGALATVAGRRTQNKALKVAAERGSSRVRARQEQHGKLRAAMERLRQQPDDPAANLTAGLDLCLFANDWQRGLPLLARSGDEPWARIATLEEQAGKDAGQRAALVDAWLAAAETQPAAMRAECQLQAKYWYGRGLPPDALADDARKRALEKLAALPGISLARLAPGLDIAMFNGGDFQEYRTRAVDAQICHRFGFGSPHPSVPGDYFSLRWTGWLKPPVPGKYVLRTSSDDSIRVRIDGKLVIDHWDRGAGGETAEVELTDQLQPLTVEYNDYTANADVCLSWALKDISDFQVVPAEAFFHDPYEENPFQ